MKEYTANRILSTEIGHFLTVSDYFSNGAQVIVIKLKEAMLAYGRKTGRNLSYRDVAEMTGIPAETLRSIGSRAGYHCPISRLEILCRTLETPLHEMLEMIDDPPELEPTPKKTKKKKKTTKKSTKKKK